MLEVDSLTTRYGAITALHRVSLSVEAGEIVALVGPNGAGKSSLLNTVAGLLRPSAGTVRFRGRDVGGLDPARLVRRRLALVPERRRIFKDLSVAENLRLAGITVTAPARRDRLAEAFARFPVLADRRDTPAGFLSGGEAQQLAIARALMGDPELLLLDEPTLGLAPTLVDVIFELLARLHDGGRTLLVVDQNARRLLAIADRGYVLRTGTITASGTGAELAAREDLFDEFIGRAP